MNFKKRILLIIFLIAFIIFVFIYYNNLEKRIISKNNYEKLELDNNYIIDKKERYIAYKEKNKNLNNDKIITYVNIGLDKGFYNKIEKVDLNKNNKILVNKFNKLNKDYEPNDLELINNKNFIEGNNSVKRLKKEAKIAFEKLSNDSINNNTPVYGQSAYRSYKTQETIYNNEIKNYGIKIADKQVARPGFSEHQTGLAIDVSSTKKGNMLNFENTKSFLWMKYNAHKYGFILRYPKNKEAIHGYIYEPWHYRYVGIKIATNIYNNYKNITYDEYYVKYLNKKKST